MDILRGPPIMSTQPGEAGASAQREYDLRKLADVKASLDKSLGDVRSALNPEPQATRAWAEGAIGERKLDAVLKSMRCLRVLSDRKVGRANIDFIVVGRSGVFVVDAKHYRGVITFRDDGDALAPDLRLYVNNQDRSHLAGEMRWQMKKVRHALATSCNPVPWVTPVLCFVDGTWSVPLPPVEFRGVRLVSERSIRNLITERQVLDADSIDRIHRALTLAFPPK